MFTNQIAESWVLASCSFSPTVIYIIWIMGFMSYDAIFYQSYTMMHSGLLLHMSSVVVMDCYYFGLLERPVHTPHVIGQVLKLAKCPNSI